MKEIKFFGVSDKFSKHDVSLTPGKGFGYTKQIHATYSVTKNHNAGINQTPRKTLVHCSGSASRETLVQVLATTTNSGIESNKFLSNQKELSQHSLAELKWWKENLLLQNNKPLKIGMPQLIIQTDASKTGWGQSVREPPQGELGHVRRGQNISTYWSSLQWKQVTNILIKFYTFKTFKPVNLCLTW